MFNYTFTDLEGHSHSSAFVELEKINGDGKVKYLVSDDHHLTYEVNHMEYSHLAELNKHFHTYVVLLDDTDNDENYYTVTCPDVLGVVTEGANTIMALKNAKEALEAILYDFDAEDKPLPKVHTIDEVKDRLDIEFNPKHMKLYYVTANMADAAKIWWPVK